MSTVSALVLNQSSAHTCHGQERGGLHNFTNSTRWVVRPDGESYGSDTRSHESLARSAGYKNADQAYANGALMVHYDAATNAIRIEVNKATSKRIALAKQILHKVPAVIAHVAIGNGDDFRSYIGEPMRIASLISRNHLRRLPTIVSRVSPARLYREIGQNTESR